MRDYLSIIAIIASFSGLLISIRTARFNSRVKAIELNSALLLKASSAIRRAESAMKELRECVKLAEDPKLQSVRLALDEVGNISEILNCMIEVREKCRAASGEQSVDAYEQYFAIVSDSDERIEQVRIRLDKVKTRMIAILAKAPPAV